MTGLVARNLRVERAGTVFVEALEFSLDAGTSVAVTGPSGSGKTSLLSVLSGLAPPDAGSVEYGGEPVRPARIGIVLQGYGLVALLTAAENIEVSLRARGWSPTAAGAAARAALAGVGMAELEEHLVEELSGGQQQRVAVARALAAAPDLLIADEPTAEQDEKMRSLVIDQLFSVPAGGGALVLATHDPQVAQRCSQRIDLTRHSA